MCGVAPFRQFINSLLDNDTAASRYREVTFRAEEVDLSSRRGRASSAQGWPGWGMERGSSSGGATPGSWNGSDGRKPSRERAFHGGRAKRGPTKRNYMEVNEPTYCGPSWGMHARRAPLI